MIEMACQHKVRCRTIRRCVDNNPQRSPGQTFIATSIDYEVLWRWATQLRRPQGKPLRQLLD